MLFRSELIKLRTVTSHWVLVIIAVAFPLVVATLVAIFSSDPESTTSTDVAGFIAGTSVISAMLLGAVSAISLTSEFSTNTIRPTFAATPSRSKVFVTKLLANTLLSVVVAGATVLACWLVASTIFTARDAELGLSTDDGTIGALVGVVALAAILTWFAFGLGLILRNSPATVSIFLLWPLLAEGLIATLLFFVDAEGAQKWLPYTAAIGAVEPDPSGDVLGRPGGLLWFAAVSLVLVAIGIATNEKRDA